MPFPGYEPFLWHRVFVLLTWTTAANFSFTHIILLLEATAKAEAYAYYLSLCMWWVIHSYLVFMFSINAKLLFQKWEGEDLICGIINYYHPSFPLTLESFIFFSSSSPPLSSAFFSSSSSLNNSRFPAVLLYKAIDKNWNEKI